jgi:hypothetical protein
MEIHERGDTLSIQPGQKIQLGGTLWPAAGILILIWAVFGVLVSFYSRRTGEILPYFVAVSLLLMVPLVLGLLIRQSRYHKMIRFDGSKGLLCLDGMWGSRRVPFDMIERFEMEQYRLKRDILLYRLIVRLVSGKTLRLVQDVPDRESLCILGERVGRLARKPLKVPH